MAASISKTANRTKPIKTHAYTAAEVRRVAKDKFGYDGLRYGQEEAIRAVLAGHDTLGVMPTGSGKSAIYQVAALLIDGPTVVVSPLIALQKDQLGSIRDKELADAVVVNSTLRVGERRGGVERVGGGGVGVLVPSPGRPAQPATC